MRKRGTSEIGREALSGDVDNMLEKIISGGQTGADRADLDAAMKEGIPVGGCGPKGRLAEDGAVPDKYPLTELNSASYHARTEKNVKDSDGTLVLNMGRLTGGTKKTVEFAEMHGKPCLVVQLDLPCPPGAVSSWIREHGIKVLNIAGPRESKCPGLYDKALEYLRRLTVMRDSTILSPIYADQFPFFFSAAFTPVLTSSGTILIISSSTFPHGAFASVGILVKALCCS